MLHSQVPKHFLLCPGRGGPRATWPAPLFHKQTPGQRITSTGLRRGLNLQGGSQLSGVPSTFTIQDPSAWPSYSSSPAGGQGQPKLGAQSLFWSEMTLDGTEVDPWAGPGSLGTSQPLGKGRGYRGWSLTAKQGYCLRISASQLGRPPLTPVASLGVFASVWRYSVPSWSQRDHATSMELVEAMRPALSVTCMPRSPILYSIALFPHKQMLCTRTAPPPFRPQLMERVIHTQGHLKYCIFLTLSFQNIAAVVTSGQPSAFLTGTFKYRLFF